jgi:hypothetical protein
MKKETQSISLESILPKDWVDNAGTVSVMESVYACLNFSPARLCKPYLAGMIDDVFYLVVESELSYTEVTSVFKGASKISPLFELKITQQKTPRSTYILFFTKYKSGGTVTEAEALSKLESARGLVNSLEGHNATYFHMFNQVIVLPKGQVSASSPVIINPQSFPRPFQNIDRVPSVAEGISKLDLSLRKKVLLALRWFDKADRETAPIDAFLNIWFAIEVLAMPDTTNIKPLNEILSKIYGKSVKETVTLFQIGRLASLRGDIVHNGSMCSIHQQLTNYVRAIFVDVLLHVTGQSPERRAESVLTDPTFPHSAWRP